MDENKTGQEYGDETTNREDVDDLIFKDETVWLASER